ncbi:MAG: peptidoglycan DD-metalloendopeptidase family protein [Deltaproteobacteria bacterium]|nr:peptidoglycan DD-metalloendopeptidase family protein [Deltaproteobacteria bacterium]
MRLPLIAVVLILSAALSLAADKPARELLKKEKKLEDVHRKIREEKKTVQAMSEKETDILGEINVVNRSLASSADALALIAASLSGIKRDMSLAVLAIERLEHEKTEVSERLALRLKAMYKLRRAPSSAFLLSSVSMDDAGRRHRNLALIMDSDIDLISDYEKKAASIDSELERLKGLRSKDEAARQEMIVALREVERHRLKKTAMLTGVRREKSLRLNVVKELEKAAVELTTLIGTLKAETAQAGGEGFASMRGKLMIPVEGRIISSYGSVKHPKFGTQTFNNGIIIEAKAYAPVRSVYDGTVIYIGWLKGYGQVMIIDNGQGFYTLFAYLSKTLKGIKEPVKKGDEVALVGESGVQNASGLYFEIRQKGVPRDPVPWFAQR